MKMTPDLAALHSYLSGDGYVSRPARKYKVISFSNTDKGLLYDFKDKFEKIFNEKARVSDVWNRCSSYSRSAHKLLTDQFGSFYSREWSIPEHLSKKCAAMWLRAFFDCEGWVWIRKGKNRAVGAESINHKGLIQIQNLLKDKFNMHSSISKHKGRTTYVLCIYRKEQLMRFEKEIGFLHSKQKVKLRIAIESFADYVWLFPEDEIKRRGYVKQIMLSKATVKKLKTIRISSTIKSNLDILSINLASFHIDSKVYGPWINGYGTKYFEMYIYDTNSIKNLIKNSMLRPEQIMKLPSAFHTN